VEVPELTWLHSGPLDELVNVLTPDPDSAPASDLVEGDDLGRQLAPSDHAVKGVELDAQQPRRFGGAHPAVSDQPGHRRIVRLTP
jgi:hypothetical protein